MPPLGVAGPGPGMAARAAAGREWAIRSALPLWAGRGYDPRQRLFFERLDNSGSPLVALPRRLTTQARQVYVFAQAALLGWRPDGASLARDAALAMIDRYLAPDKSAGWVFSIDADGSPSDARRELYAHAFALFGLAWAYRLGPDSRLLEARDVTMALLDGPFSGPHGGYLSFIGDDGSERLQNPHMHLLEAMLAWHETTGEADFLTRAQALGTLFAENFFQRKTFTLPEYFDSNWGLRNDERGRMVEPGHHFEWSWLLHRLQSASGQETRSVAAPLYDYACRYGYDADGLIVDCLRNDGSVMVSSRRTWPHTEAIKAHAAACEWGDRRAEGRCAQTWDAMFAHFLSGAVSGGWRDHLDGAGAPLHDHMPATTLYHVLCAIVEANRVWPA